MGREVMSSPPYAIETSELTKRYKIRETKPGDEQKSRIVKLLVGESFKGRIEAKDKVVVDHVNLRVEEGECLGLLGPNGAGKSTLLEILSTGVLPDEGTARIMGHDINKEREVAKGYITPVFPMFGANQMWTARQNLEYVALLYNLSKQEMMERIGDVVGRVGLGERIDEIVNKYSSGMRVRLTLAMGLMIDNPVYLMDEPLVGIDPGTAKEIREFLKKELIAKGRTILIATHILADAEELCDRVAIIQEGKIVATDTPANLKRKIEGTETVEMEVLTDNGQAMVDALKALDGVEACILSPAPPDQAKVASMRIHTHDSRRLLPSLIDKIQGMDGKVRYVKVSEPTLEDVFIHYTGKRLSE
jgi:ABC-2 type transport system ATP-binding protein